MKIDINTLLKIIGTIITIGAILWGLAGEFNGARVERAELLMYIKVLETGQNILMEERMVKMERTELYNRMNRILNRTDEDNYSIDAYVPNDYETKSSEKK